MAIEEVPATLIVCHCFKVSDREIRLTIELGARDVEAVGDGCGAGWGCGGCHESIQKMIEKAIRKIEKSSSKRAGSKG